MNKWYCKKIKQNDNICNTGYINLSYINVELVQVSDISQANQKRCVNTFRGVSSNRITLHTQKL